jgi:collagen type VII alpha
MKRISTSAATAVLLACSVALGAQTSSTGNPSTSTPRQGTATQSGSAGADGQGSATQGNQGRSTTRENQSGSTQRESAAAPQQSATRTASRTASASRSANRPEEITLTGCLQANDQGAASASTATAGTSAARRAQSNQIPTFTLANATQGAGQPSSEPRSVGTSGTTGSGGAASASGASGTTGNAQSSSNAQSNNSGYSLNSGGSGSYILQGMDLTRQAGQQVEVTGTVVMPPAARRNAGRRASATAGATDATASMQHVRVTSVRMLADHCGQ